MGEEKKIRMSDNEKVCRHNCLSHYLLRLQMTEAGNLRHLTDNFAGLLIWKNKLKAPVKIIH